MLVKVSKKGFLRKSLDAGMYILKGNNVERAVAKKEHMTKMVGEMPTNSKFPQRRGNNALNLHHDLATKHDARIRKEKLKTTVARGGMFGGIMAGTVHGLGDVNAREAAKAQDQDFYAVQPKLAAVEFNNIPKDTSKPTTQSPTDGTDYYDYQEWLAAETDNAPDRSNLPVIGADEKNAPLKIAHELGCDLYVVNAIEEYQGTRELMKEAAEAVPDAPVPGTNSVSSKVKQRLAKSKGSKLLGAALIAGGVYATARAAANLYGMRPDLRHDWYN